MGANVVEVGSLPVYFIDTVLTEDAGDGNVRVINCVTRGGVLVPQFEVIIHASRLLLAGRAVAEKAQAVFNTEMMQGGSRH